MPQRKKSKANAAEITYYKIGSIDIYGLETTKKQTVIRELPYQEGQLLPLNDIKTHERILKQRLESINLFNNVVLKLKPDSTLTADIDINVHEQRYHIGYPFVELADRNFNEWWTEQNHEIGRLKMGGEYYHKNFRGKRETIGFGFALGFTQQLYVKYKRPYINLKQTIGMNIYAEIQRSKQVSHTIDNNQLQFLFDRDYLRRITSGGVVFTAKPKINTKYAVGIHGINTLLRNTLNEEASNILPSQATNYIQLNALITHDRQDNPAFPLNGYLLSFETIKKGLQLFDEVNHWEFYGNARYFKSLNRVVHTGALLTVKASTHPENQLYALRSGLGYNDERIRGFERFVVDAQHFALLKLETRFHLFSYDFTKSKSKLISEHGFPFSIYFKVFHDLGYTNGDFTDANTNDFLANQYLNGTGVGLDIFYNLSSMLSVEYAITNQFNPLTNKRINAINLTGRIGLADLMHKPLKR